jgi:ABC-type lipoprotein export system ATPase subunit
VADSEVTALDGVSLAFRNSEFVAILGQSGCGKTTLLNIVGGLDHYTSGDLVINGMSTKDYTDADWDAYRNHSVGFVFQSYNLIPHQTVLANVEMALRIGGVPASEQRERALAALEKVGLADQVDKKPAMMSGGQMQRVAIARALVNDPDIVLADEPTGALDSQTSVQIMDLLAEIAKDRLVVMVTHNPELADRYATRIVRLSDGRVVDDSNPPTAAELEGEPEQARPPHTRLPFRAALSLSLANLMTKKGRTFLTAFAGAIGIIGIALILSLSTGMNDYIAKIESETMGSYPIELEQTTIDFTSMMKGAQEESDAQQEYAETDHTDDEDSIVSNNVVARSLEEAQELVKENDLGAFKTYLDAHMAEVDPYLRAVEYDYDVNPVVWRETDDGVSAVSPTTLLESDATGYASMTMSVSSTTSCTWSQLVDDQKLREEQYELLAGEWPDAADEAVLVVNSRNKVSDFVLYKLGLLDEDRMQEIIDAVNDGESVDDPVQKLSFDQAIGKTYTVFSPSQLYREVDGVWIDKSADEDFMAEEKASGEGVEVKIVGVIRAGESASVTSGVAYTYALTEKLMDIAADQEIVKAQLADKDVNVLTGEEFSLTTASTLSSLDAAISSQMGSGMSTRASSRGAESVISKLGNYTGNATLSTADDETTSDVDADAAEKDGYTVTFENYDGQVISEKGGYAAGDAVTDVPATDPVRAADAQTGTTYYFIGWRSDATGAVYTDAADIPAVEGDTVYTAFFLGVPATLPEGVAPGTSTTLPGGLTQDQIAEIVNQYQAEQAPVDMSNISFDDLVATGLIDPDQLAADYMDSIDTEQLIADYMASMTPEQLSELYGVDGLDLSQDQIDALMAKMSSSTPSTYSAVLSALGYATPDSPTSIRLYPTDFEAKQEVQDFIDRYNDQCADESETVTYNDLVGTMTKSITEIIDILTAVLVAFVSISLVVSSIMIAIITYISVLERTKEIGILRALGASKRDVSRIFNAETFIEGLLSGVLGVVVTALLDIPISAFIYSHYGAENIARLPLDSAFALILIAVVLTLVAGFIPARMAAKKDPVVALRSE